MIHIFVIQREDSNEIMLSCDNIVLVLSYVLLQTEIIIGLNNYPIKVLKEVLNCYQEKDSVAKQTWHIPHNFKKLLVQFYLFKARYPADEVSRQQN